MNINRDNYPNYVSSFLDHTLSTVEHAEFLLFLELNPDIEEEISEIGKLILDPETKDSYLLKELLVQPFDADAHHINLTNFEFYFAADAEGDLSEAGHQRIFEFAAHHPETNSTYLLMQRMRLEPDTAIIYPAKSAITKKATLVLRPWISGAAAIAVLFLIVEIFWALNPLQQNQTAQQSPATQQQQNTGNTKKPASATEKQRVQKVGADTEPKKARFVVKKTQPYTEPKTESMPIETPSEEPLINRVPSKGFLNKTSEPFNGNLRNFYSSLFDEIRDSQESFLASLENEPEKRILPRAGTGQRVNQILKSGAQIASQVPGAMNGWTIANLGLEGFNMLTDNNLKLKRIANADGRTQKVKILDGDAGYTIGRRHAGN